jgi:hypothetical protein
MKVFEVFYSGADYNGFKEIVLAENEGGIGCALEEKSLRKYEVGSRYCRIDRYREIPLSKVKISDLSITEFLKVTNQ